MGKLVGVSRQTISQIERGNYAPSVTLALKIAKVLNVSVKIFLVMRRTILMNNNRVEEIKQEDKKAF